MAGLPTSGSQKTCQGCATTTKPQISGTLQKAYIDTVHQLKSEVQDGKYTHQKNFLKNEKKMGIIKVNPYEFVRHRTPE